MNSRIVSLSMAVLTMAACSAAYADIHVDVNPFGWGAPPPVVYESPRYYAPPPVVYYGQGRYGEHDGRYGERDRGGRDHYRGRSEHRDEGDRGHHDDR